MNKSLLGLALVALTTIGGIVYHNVDSKSTEQALFEEWKQKIGVTFDANEAIYRFKVFQENLKKINEHNSKLGKSHEEGLNNFAFLTAEEFRAQYLTQFQSSNPILVVDEKPTVNGPIIDWVSYGAVSPVKNQGQCVASYAFSAIGAIEGVSVIFYKTQQEYSVQQLIDCSQSYGNNGCLNGRMDFSFNYVRDRGINTESAYPYKGYQSTCLTNSGLFKIKGYSNVTDCTSLSNALTVRPISVAVDGNNFQFYKSGIFTNCNTNLSLAVLLVGMTDNNWTLKNCWGQSWGEGGYIRIGRGNTCGVCQVGSYPVVN